MPLSSAASLILLLVTLISCLEPTIGQGLELKGVGVCNGRLGNDLPSEQKVVEFYKANGIGKMRIYYPNAATLLALRSSGIQLILDVPNNELERLARNALSTMHWVQTNVVNFFPDVNFRYISVGNEVDTNGASSSFAQFVLPAMQNIRGALPAAGLGDQIKVSTATNYTALIENSYPRSAASFGDDAWEFIAPIIYFLGQTGAPLLANIYPYFAYIDDTQNIKLLYALFTADGVVVQDGEFGYWNLFDEMVDTMLAAVERAGGQGMEIVISESGWPSEGGTGATMENAATYYRNLIKHARGSGTPRRPGKAIETYLFAMFDENEKWGVLKHFGLFYPNKQPKYQPNA